MDDIIASGETMLQAVYTLQSRCPRPPIVIAIHGLFVGEAAKRIERAGATIVSTNSVAHPSNRIDIGRPLATEISILLNKSISAPATGA